MLDKILKDLNKCIIRLQKLVDKNLDEIIANNNKILTIRDANTELQQEKEKALKVMNNLKKIVEDV